ncbi:rod shape-determining protein MreC [Jannaschia sp. Os4]|uniref:rod shape-determining protein MreC n=1 Tax=Jannaschia sp. Os4 TaxID=2807617 RepID=UPI0019394A51|nr:rod shape-determining protein MreC [Jannaschia sp. Os4]MBM2574756.1 rod shape-determining protein MreC [Jannaschia sp. Os4]
MAKGRSSEEVYARPVRRLLLTITCVCLVLLVLLWRIDNPRAERLRAAVVDAVVPNVEWALGPVTWAGHVWDDFEGYARVYEQNRELRRELQAMQSWREAALQLEQENARLLDLNQVRLSPGLTYVTGVVMTDSGSPFRRSVLINIGREDGVRDGWAAMDGLGLVGRISGVGDRTSRVILVTDGDSRIPVTVQPSGLRAVLSGDTTAFPVLEFIERPEDVRAGDRVVTSGDGGVFPPDLLVGRVVLATDGRLRLRLAADTTRLEFLRILRTRPPEPIEGTGELVAPPGAPGLAVPLAQAGDEETDAGEGG